MKITLNELDKTSGEYKPVHERDADWTSAPDILVWHERFFGLMESDPGTAVYDEASGLMLP